MPFEEFIPRQRFFTHQYLQLLRRLLPRGPLWDRLQIADPPNFTPASSWLGRLLSCFASELWRFDTDVVRLLRESVPGLAEELLEDWERVAGLPDESTPAGLTDDQRRVAVHTKIHTVYSGLSEQFYIDYAADLGITITIAAYAGGSTFRVTRKSDGRTQRVTQMPSPGGVDDSRLSSASITSQWTVTVVADPDGNRELMERVFNKIKPAWTGLTFLP